MNKKIPTELKHTEKVVYEGQKQGQMTQEEYIVVICAEIAFWKAKADPGLNLARGSEQQERIQVHKQQKEDQEKCGLIAEWGRRPCAILQSKG